MSGETNAGKGISPTPLGLGVSEIWPGSPHAGTDRVPTSFGFGRQKQTKDRLFLCFWNLHLKDLYSWHCSTINKQDFPRWRLVCIIILFHRTAAPYFLPHEPWV
ncbi:hypothetical protein SK128_010993 [Halocaridina rubra]|uniref:Uncharacterized protein n=1 Tax=Halocaridina rubra TaxID=373956 RepID=A0AAN9ADK2_HALRR